MHETLAGRLSDSLIVNDALLTGIGLLGLLLVIWVGLLGNSLALRWLLRTSRAGPLIRVGDWLVRSVRRLAIVGSALAVLVALGLLGWGILWEVDFQPWLDQAAAGLTARTPWQALQAVLVLAGLVLGLWYLNRIRKTLLPRLWDRLAQLRVFAGYEAQLNGIFRELPDLLSLIGVYLLVGLMARMLDLGETLVWAITTLCTVALVVNAVQLVVQVGQLAVDVLARFAKKATNETKVQAYYERVENLVPLARRVVEAIAYLGGTIVVVGRFDALEAVAPYGSTAIELVGVFFFGRVVVELVGVLVYEVLTRDVADEQEGEVGIEQDVRRAEIRARRETLARLVQSLARSTIYLGMLMVMLLVLGVDPLPLFAGVGVVGFAVGLGSQKIVQDIICGFFMLMEDQMLVGDYVKVGDTEGRVEALQLRVSRIRDRFGRVHTLCNGDVGNVINYSRGWTLAVVEMSVAYEADLPEVLRVMAEVGRQLHEELPSDVLEPACVMGVEAMDESCLRVRIEAKVRPGAHYEVKRALNRLLFEAFVANGLEIPYPKGIEYDGVPGYAESSAPDPA